jgi:hypothetical protein
VLLVIVTKSVIKSLDKSEVLHVLLSDDSTLYHIEEGGFYPIFVYFNPL